MRWSAVCLLGLSVLVLTAPVTLAQSAMHFGFGKVDITPSVPLRLSGYGSRTDVFEGVDERLYARAMALRSGESLAVLISVDTIGFPETLTNEIAARVEQRHKVPRSRFVLCCTHSHTAPHISGGLTNILAVPLTGEQSARSLEYRERVTEAVVSAVDQATGSLAPGRLETAQGEVDFADNRRLLEGGELAGVRRESAGTDRSQSASAAHSRH